MYNWRVFDFVLLKFWKYRLIVLSWFYTHTEDTIIRPLPPESSWNRKTKMDVTICVSIALSTTSVMTKYMTQTNSFCTLVYHKDTNHWSRDHHHVYDKCLAIDLYTDSAVNKTV